ncbi:N-acetylmuramoyl-L-alanine amidase family protein [Salisediminibacterium halotolerans]|uniref:N-acetylmuramoyl-L-alanine amidase family protein n=1 Tax=Salisediminibacterium halotolerans TaxID=517425 RepID=UPI000F167F44|nr:N-acetylmuramoyl-L-alanine amidase [Salisediminibacterium halotolerans]RLJ75588.1 N-acetylmuramoyl-L-alanine amidase [Actinophytocola xinjiangensis]RPE89442.1 N-acetylmuramoyl-L-alanine amidase [Salisediminibacterium halotolerans]TWG36201.1 N-acetylmuramoyl-L-alanine amidase [Salisediminibacterium halotolerans]GEL08186.1 hypothetical protein SHA02_16020 [Salisediminibacterium halotolerans]
MKAGDSLFRHVKMLFISAIVVGLFILSLAYSFNDHQGSRDAEASVAPEFAAGPDMQSFMLGAMARGKDISVVNDQGAFYEVAMQGETTTILGSYADIAMQEASPFVDGALNGMTIYVDPGHGGADPGAIVNGDIHESELMLDIGLRLEEWLIDEGAFTKLSRRDDSFVDNDDRVADSKKVNADVFISLHANTYGSSSVHGTEVYFNRDAYPEQSEQLAADIQHTLTEDSGFANRGIRAEELNVIEHPHMPSVLVEIGYMTNGEDLEKLKNGQEDIVARLASGIVRYAEQ